MLAQVIPAFRTERARVGDGFHIGLNARERFLRFPRPVRGVEASARFAGAAGCGRVASEDVGREVNAVLGEVSGEALASVVGFLVALEDALLYVGVGCSGLAFVGFGQVVPCLFAVLVVALDPLAHALGVGVASPCGLGRCGRCVCVLR